MPVSVEVCCEHIESVIAAYEGGADRVELCADLANGGVTPSIGLVKVAREILRRAVAQRTALHVLVRPRGGPFCYTDIEWSCVLSDVEACRDAGADAVVVGALDFQGHIDHEKIAQVVQLARPMKVCFHRAFDVCTADHVSDANATEEAFAKGALDRLAAAGVDFVLTSGRAASAWEGRQLISSLASAAPSTLRIMAGASVSADNVAALIAATRVCDVHAASSVCSDRRPGYISSGSGASMGAASAGREDVFRCVDTCKVKALVAAANPG
jgi:copper homeostasis protein